MLAPLRSLLMLVILVCTVSAQSPVRKDSHGDPLPEGALARLGTIKLRPGDVVRHLAFSPDGKQIACWAGGPLRTANALAIYDVASGKQLRWVAAFDSRCHDFVWAPDGRGIALVQPHPREDRFLMWEFTDSKTSLPKRTTPLAGDARVSPRVFALSPDGQWVVSSGASPQGFPQQTGEMIELRRWQSGKTFAETQTVETIGLAGLLPRKLAFSSGNKSLLAMCKTKDRDETKAILVDMETRKFRHTTTVAERLSYHSNHVDLSPLENSVAFQRGGSARLVELAGGKERLQIALRDLLMTDHPILEEGILKFSPDGKYLALSQRTGPLRLWNLKENKEVWRTQGSDELFTALAFSPDGSLLATGEADGAIRLWVASAGKELSPAEPFQQTSWMLTLAPSGNTAASFGRDMVLRLWDLQSGSQLRSTKVGDSINGLAFTPDSNCVLFTCQGKMFQWNHDSKIASVQWTQNHAIGPFHLAGDGNTLVTLHDGQVSIWDWSKESPRATWKLGESRPRTYYSSISATPDCSLFALFGRSGDKVCLEIWDAKNQKKIRDISRGQEFSYSALSPDGTQLAEMRETFPPIITAGEPELVLLEAPTGRAIRSFKAPLGQHDPRVRNVCEARFSPDGRLLASAENNHCVVFFETATGLPRRVLSGHRNSVTQLAFTPDGRRLVTLSEDLTGLVWDLSLPIEGKRNASVEQVTKAWESLRNARDGIEVQDAIAALGANPERFLKLCKLHLHPAMELDPQSIKKWIADLDSPEFAVRTHADKELERLGNDVVPLLRTALTKDMPLEQSRRLQKLITRLNPDEPTPKRLEEMRAVELLEYLATPESRHFLERLAGGARQARLTVDARASLDRLAKQRQR
ncbi:MAG: WD40 repeat domain-containing protein [Planctomycetes bacterium]|nr:WD40 repeat domain-containing protein [Planctomycetota bacterium]